MFGPRIDGDALHARRRHEYLLDKLSRTRSDIVFLSQCKKLDIVPKGLRLRSPFNGSSSSSRHIAERICERASRQLRNHAIKSSYAKQNALNLSLSTSEQCLKDALPDYVDSNAVFKALDDSYKRKLNSCFKLKSKKLVSLINKDPITKFTADKDLPFLTSNFPKSVRPKKQSSAEEKIANLSDYQLSRTEKSVLEKGLSFCPSRRLDEVGTCFDFKQFERRVRLREYFGDDDDTQTYIEDYVSSQQPKSTWTPPEGRNAYIENFTKTARAHLDSFLSDNRHHDTPRNLAASQYKAIRSLRTNTEIVVRPADKGGCVTLLNTQDYISEAETQLNDSRFYRLITDIPTFSSLSRNLFDTLSDDILPTVQKLIPRNPKVGYFYTLPKIHKLPKLIENSLNSSTLPSHTSDLGSKEIFRLAKTLNLIPPGRPIISGVGTFSEGLSGYVDSLLNPLLFNIPSFIQDTTHFLRVLNNIGTLPANTLLVTMDVTSLYTNIPHEEGILASREFMLRHSFNQTLADDVSNIIKFVLTNNFFTFNDKNYLQIKGTAMGTKMAPCYANIFMEKLESEMLNSFILKPIHYYRYIDDIFFIWPHGLESLESFKLHANSFHHSIKFTFEVSDSRISFLDVLVKLRSNSLSTSVYYKPTDNHQFLHFDSAHPLSLKKSIVYSQCLRIKRICSDKEDFNIEISNLIHFFLSNGYPMSIIKNGIEKANKSKREDLLTYNSKKSSDRIPLVLEHHPLVHSLARTIKQDFALLKGDSSLPATFSKPPLLALRQPPNLRQLLTSSKLPPFSKLPPGNKSCNKPRCQVCDHISQGSPIFLPFSEFPIKPPNLDCDSQNVVYLLYCTMCPKGLYVGETSTKFRYRFNNHKKSIRDNARGFPVAEHFGLTNHSLRNLKCVLLGSNFQSPRHRKRTELDFILKLNTHTEGLNRDLGPLNHFTFYNDS